LIADGLLHSAQPADYMRVTVTAYHFIHD